MHILVTGASGFLGKALCPILRDRGHRVVESSTRTCDLQSPTSLNQYNNAKFDQIFHLAVWSQAGDFCMKHPGEQWIINQKINTNMLDWWHRKQPQAKIIAMGTSCSYDPAYPLEEEYYLAGSPIESLMAYGITKRALLCGLQSLHQQFGHDYLFLIPSTLYGIEGYHNDGKQLHFIFDLIRKIMKGKLYDEKVILWGDGEQKRELIHVADFVDTMLTLAENEKNQAINIGEGREHSIKEFAQIICDQVDYPFSKIEFDESRYVGARSKVLLLDKLKSLVPQFNTRHPTDGIGEIVNWLAENKDLL